MRLPYEYFPLDSRALGERKREEELKALAPSMSFFFYNLLVYALHRLLKNAFLSFQSDSTSILKGTAEGEVGK